jgi:hypothetical protein
MLLDALWLTASLGLSFDLFKNILKVLGTIGVRWKKQISSFGICKNKSYSDYLEYIQSSNRIIYRRLNIVLFRVFEIQCDQICLFRLK